MATYHASRKKWPHPADSSSSARITKIASSGAPTTVCFPYKTCASCFERGVLAGWARKANHTQRSAVKSAPNARHSPPVCATAPCVTAPCVTAPASAWRSEPGSPKSGMPKKQPGTERMASAGRGRRRLKKGELIDLSTRSTNPRSVGNVDGAPTMRAASSSLDRPAVGRRPSSNFKRDS